MPEVITANKLHTGTVVYLDQNGHWVETLDLAALAFNADGLKRLEGVAADAVARNEVTSVYAFDVRVINGRTQPLSVREKIRAAHAPTV